MKDALGHGSNAGGNGVHAQAINKLPAKLTRAHFEQIAAGLRSAPDAGSEEHTVRVNLAAERLATTNPGFRRDLFMKAALPDLGKGSGPYKNRSRDVSLKNASKKAAKVLAQF